MKSQARYRRHKKQSYTGLWFFTIFLFIAFTLGLVYLGKHRYKNHLIPPVSTPITEKTKIENSAKNSITKNADTKSTMQKITETKQPEVKPSETKPAEPKFDFYTLLPQGSKSSAKTVTTNEKYLLESDKEQDFAKIDKLKAQLALLGFETQLITTMENKVKIYQLTIGPFDNKKIALKNQKTLLQNRIKSTIKSSTN